MRTSAGQFKNVARTSNPTADPARRKTTGYMDYPQFGITEQDIDSAAHPKRMYLLRARQYESEGGRYLPAHQPAEALPQPVRDPDICSHHPVAAQQRPSHGGVSYAPSAWGKSGDRHTY